MINFREHLCVYDPRSDVFTGDEDSPPPRVSCGCDRCFYGRDKLALEIERLEQEVDKLRQAGMAHK